MIMANMKNAKKKILTIAKETVNNNNYKASMRTAIKNVEKAVNTKDKSKANDNLKVAVKRIDKATSVGVIKKNTAARNKSRIMKKVNELD